MTKLNLLNYFLILFISCLFFSCGKEPLSATNQLYEMLYDDALDGRVKDLEYIDGNLKFSFNCDRNLASRTITNTSDTWTCKYDGDTIINQIREYQKLLYILDENGRVKEYVSLVWDGKKWYTYYKEDWNFDKEGRLKNKSIQSRKADTTSYFVNREEYVYGDRGKVEIFKYGKDEGSKTKNGLLRTETRLANENGDWMLIEELDEDGIPYRKSNFIHTYDKEGNWTQVILNEEDNYTGRTTKDTIQRKISYYAKNECK
ncbi:MAG: hypothetical protein ACI94Y_001071 [Maribacter sp.]|jgi:hypothetical protein